MSDSDSSNGIFITPNPFPRSSQPSWEIESLLDLRPEPFDGLDDGETVLKLF